MVHILVGVSYFCVAVINYHDPGNLKKERLIWLAAEEGGSLLAGRQGSGKASMHNFSV